MTTATEYRQFAQECIESARTATSEPVRHQFLEIPKLWLIAADKLDGGVFPDNKPGDFGADGRTPPKQRGITTDESI